MSQILNIQENSMLDDQPYEPVEVQQTIGMTRKHNLEQLKPNAPLVRKIPTLGGLDLQSLVAATDENLFFRDKGTSKGVSALADLIDF
jgi:hypothetical protein